MNRILYICAFVPNQYSAGENFSRQILQSISENNPVDLIYFKYSTDQPYIKASEKVQVLKEFRNSRTVKILNAFLFPLLFPLFTVRFNLARLRYIKRCIKKTKYDLIVFDFSQTFLFARFIKGVPKLLNCHDVITQRYSRIYSGLLSPWVKQSEKYVLNARGTTIFCPSEKDSNLVARLTGRDAIPTTILIDNMVLEAMPKKVDDYFIFFANWKRPDNSEGLAWFLKQVLPDLSGDFKAIIIGAGLSESLKSQITRFGNIEYKGFIDNPYPILANAKALISPLFTGAGIKVKVLESLCCGTEVIGSDISFEGVPETYSNFIINVNTSAEIAGAITDFETHMDAKKELKRLFVSTYPGDSIADWINKGIYDM